MRPAVCSRVGMATSRLFLFCFGCLCMVSAPQAAFERAVFPQPPLTTGFRPTISPADLSDLRQLCGGIRHDRPFGLAALSGHGLLLATPLSARLGLGFGMAQRGPRRHREYSAWIGAGLRLHALISIGVAARQLAWRGMSARGATVGAFSVGGQVTLSQAWSLAGAMEQGTRISPARTSLRLLHHDAAGSVAGGLSTRGSRRAVPSVTMVSRLTPRLSVAGQMRSVARSFGLGATMHGVVDLHMRTESHPALGPSWTLGWGRSCR